MSTKDDDLITLDFTVPGTLYFYNVDDSEPIVAANRGLLARVGYVPASDLAAAVANVKDAAAEVCHSHEERDEWKGLCREAEAARDTLRAQLATAEASAAILKPQALAWFAVTNAMGEDWTKSGGSGQERAVKYVKDLRERVTTAEQRAAKAEAALESWRKRIAEATGTMHEWDFGSSPGTWEQIEDKAANDRKQADSTLDEMITYRDSCEALCSQLATLRASLASAIRMAGDPGWDDLLSSVSNTVVALDNTGRDYMAAEQRAAAAERDLTCARENQTRAAEQVAAAEQRAAKAEAHVTQFSATASAQQARAERAEAALTTATVKLAAYEALEKVARAIVKVWRDEPEQPDGDDEKWSPVCLAMMAAVDSLPTAHRPGEDGPCGECEHCERGPLTAPCKPCIGKRPHINFTRRLPVAPAETCGECSDLFADGYAGPRPCREKSSPHYGKDRCKVSAACPAFEQRMPVAEYNDCDESDPACPAFARRLPVVVAEQPQPAQACVVARCCSTCGNQDPDECNRHCREQGHANWILKSAFARRESKDGAQ